MGGRVWDDAGDAFLRTHYPRRGARWCQDRLPGRSIAAIHSRAGVLRITDTESHKPLNSTPLIDAMIRRAYTSARPKGWRTCLAKQCGQADWWISRRAVQLGLTKARETQPWSDEERAFANARPDAPPHGLSRLMRKRGWRRTATAISTARSHGVLHRSAPMLQEADPAVFSAPGLAHAMGVNLGTVRSWIFKGWLIAKLIPPDDPAATSRGRFEIHERDVAAFALANPTRISLTKLEPNKVWFLDLIARFPRLPSREDGTLQRRVQSIAAARPKLSEGEIAALVESTAETVRGLLRRRTSKIQTQQEAA